MKIQKTFKVIIVGGGVAGLAAANYLARKGVDEWLVLEGRDKLGGRIETVSFGDEGRIELGAQWIHGEKSDFCDLVKKSAHRHEMTSWEGRGDFLLPNGEKGDVKLVKEVVDWVESKIEFVEESFTIETVQDGGEEGEESNMGRFLRQGFLEELKGQGVLEGSDEYELRMAVFQWAMSFQRIDNSCNKMTDVSLYRWSEFDVCPGEHYNNFKEGARSFVDNVLVEPLPKERIKVDSQVVEILWDKGSLEDPVEIRTKDGSLYFAHCVLVTCSIGVLKATSEMFQPELPLGIRTAINSTGFGPIGKVFLKWDDPWWPVGTEGFQFLWPKKYIDCCDESCEDDVKKNSEEMLRERWVKSFTGFDPVLDSPKWLLGWLGGPEASFVETISETEVGNGCAKLLSQFTGFSVSPPDEVYVSKWNNDEFFRGAYSFRAVEGDKIPGDICSVLSEPVVKNDALGNQKPVIFLAGEALSKTHYSTLHGAYKSGVDQAAKIFKLLCNDSTKYLNSFVPNGLPKTSVKSLLCE